MQAQTPLLPTANTFSTGSTTFRILLRASSNTALKYPAHCTEVESRSVGRWVVVGNPRSKCHRWGQELVGKCRGLLLFGKTVLVFWTLLRTPSITKPLMPTVTCLYPPLLLPGITSYRNHLHPRCSLSTSALGGFHAKTLTAAGVR